MEKIEKASKKEVIIILFILVILVIILGVLLNDGSDSNEQLSSEFADYLVVDNDNNLQSINNVASFKESSYKKNSKDYIKAKSKYMSIHVISMLSEENDEINFENLDSEKLIYLLNAILAGEGENVCYTQQYFKQKIYEYFGIREIEFDSNSSYYEIDANSICFEEIFFNMIPNGEITNYVDDGKSVRAFITIEEKNILFNYEKIGDNIFLKSVENVN